MPVTPFVKRFIDLWAPTVERVNPAKIWVEDYRDSVLVPSGQAFAPESLLGFVRNAEGGDTRQLYAFYDEARARDAHLDCELSKAEEYLTGARIDILPYPPRLRSRSVKSTREARKATDCRDYIEEQFFSPSVRADRIISGLADGLWKGMSVLEPVVAPGQATGGRERLVSVTQIPSQRLRYAPMSTTLGIQQTSDENSWREVKPFIDAGRLMLLEAEPEVPSPARRGLMRRILGLWMVRLYGPQWWVRFVELFGSPMRVGKYNPADPLSEQRIVKALKTAGSGGWAALPEGAAIEFIESQARSTGVAPHELLLDWAAREMSKVILGATQGTDVQRNTGSRASAQVHHDVAIARSASRAVIIGGVIREQLFKPLVSRNFGTDIAELYTPEIRIRVENRPDLYNVAQAIKMLVDAGLDTIPKSWAHDITSIPIPDEDEPVIVAPLVPGDPRANQGKQNMPEPTGSQKSDPNAPEPAPKPSDGGPNFGGRQ